jgi:osmotically inducible protein OsmC
MADIKRKGTAVWSGSLREGDGALSVESAAMRDEAYAFGTRFENEPGTNPEELIAAAHAGCYSMAIANVLAQNGYEVEGIETTATVHLAKTEGGFDIHKSALEVRGRVPEIDEATFKELAEKADKGCPVSNLLRPGLDIEIEAMLA